MTAAELERATPEQRAENMRRFRALWRLSEAVRRDPKILSLPPRTAVADEPRG